MDKNTEATPQALTRRHRADLRAGRSILGNTSLRFRMRLINGIFAAGIVSFIVITHQALQVQLNATDDLIRLNDAEQYAEDADRLHDSLRGDLYAALLAPKLNETKTQAFLRAWQSEVRRFRDDLDHQAKLVLPPSIEKNVAQTRQKAEEFLVRSGNLMYLAEDDQHSMLAQLPKFEQRFSQLGATFSGLNTLLSEQIADRKSQAAATRDRADRLILLAAALIIAGTMLLAWTITYSIQRSVRHVSAVAKALAAGDLDVRYQQPTSHEVGAIGASLNVMAESLEQTLRQMRTDSEHERFNKQLNDALEIADSERDIADVVARAMESVTSMRPMELLLDDASRSRLQRAAEHPDKGPPGCAVPSPDKCVAVRRGNPLVYRSSDALNACPYLRGRANGDVCAVCVPLSFMGRSLGVLHATGPAGEPFDEAQIAALENLALSAGTRIGTVRAFQRTQLQALTDSMTGLPNRRAVEMDTRELSRIGAKFALVMADLDHFKQLNDTLGHETGDKALRIFADATKACLRKGDNAARWGGEEFLIVLVDATASQAAEWVDRLRRRLADDCQRNDIKSFTASFGIADSSMASHLADQVRIADSALYVAKNGGRDRTSIGKPDFALQSDRQDSCPEPDAGPAEVEPDQARRA